MLLTANIGLLNGKVDDDAVLPCIVTTILAAVHRLATKGEYFNVGLSELARYFCRFETS